MKRIAVYLLCWLADRAQDLVGWLDGIIEKLEAKLEAKTGDRDDE